MKVTTRRHTADERREAILDAALAEFAHRGLHATSTDAIARRAGVSQPYLFKLFGTKKDLFVATVEAGFERTLERFRRAAEERPEGVDVFEAMGQAYIELLANRDALLGQLQAYAACDDADVRDVVRRGYGALYEFVEAVSGRSEDEVRQFFATGMLINVMAAMDLESLDEPWARRCLGPCLRSK